MALAASPVSTPSAVASQISPPPQSSTQSLPSAPMPASRPGASPGRRLIRQRSPRVAAKGASAAIPAQASGAPGFDRTASNPASGPSISACARYRTEASRPSSRIRTAPSFRAAAPVTSKGEPSAADISATACAASPARPESVITASGAGWTLRLTSEITPSVPQLPAISFTRS